MRVKYAVCIDIRIKQNVGQQAGARLDHRFPANREAVIDAINRNLQYLITAEFGHIAR